MTRTTKLLATLCLVGTLATAGVVAAPALATGNAVINDCQNHGELTRQFTRAELRHALKVMSASIKQYTSCQSVIQNALDKGTTGLKGTGTGSGGGSFLPVPVIIVIIVLVLAAVTFGGLAIRRRRGDPGDPDGGGDGDGVRLPRG